MKSLLFIVLSGISSVTFSQNNKDAQYPIPEYNNEIYLLKKDSSKLVRLEKENSKMKTKTKMGGIGGSESGYTIAGEKSMVRLSSGNNLSFVLYTGKPPSLTSSASTDSMMKANKTSIAEMNEMMEMFNNPEKNTSLYEMDPGKEERKIITMSSQGMKIFGKAKKESKKYTLSIKKVKEGYYEILVDKSLPKGEYSFVIMDMMSRDMNYMLFAFAVD